MRARSVSPAVAALMQGPPLSGRHLGIGFCDFDGYVVALTRPGRPRLPNGVECDLELAPQAAVLIGDGRLETRGRCVVPGPIWEPVPRVRFLLEMPGAMRPEVESLAGLGGGLTPAGDDVLAGYAAGLLLFHGRGEEAAGISERAARRTTSLSATLLRHAGAGELPEPAHQLLELGDPEPLRCYGHSSGRYLMLGLALGCAAC